MPKAKVYRADLYGLREGKYQYLWNQDLDSTVWTELQTQSPYFLFAEQDYQLYADYEKGQKVSDIFQ